MPTRSFPLAPGQPARLEVETTVFSGTRVRFDGHELGHIENKKALTAGREFALPGDLGSVRVQLVTSFGNAGLHVTRNGRPVPGSDGHPQKKFASACGVVFFIAGLNLLIGVAGFVVENEVLGAIGGGWPAFGFGATFAALGAWLRLKRSRIALALALGIYVLDGLATVGISLSTPGGTPPIGMIFLRVLFSVAMFAGFKAIRDLDEDERTSSLLANVSNTFG